MIQKITCPAKELTNSEIKEKLNEIINLINKPSETTNEQLSKTDIKRLHDILYHTKRGYLPHGSSLEEDEALYQKLQKLIV